MSQPGGTRKFRLRRLGPQKDVIQKNLEPLKQNIQKKKRAQALYYMQHNVEGLSPLKKEMTKEPVHQRLGQRQKLREFFGTNTSAVMPKKRSMKFINNRNNNGQMNNTNNKLNNKKTRAFSAQYRLNKIRQNQRQSLNVPQNNSANKKKTFRLRRSLPQVQQQQINGNNFTVQVKNSDHPLRFKLELTPSLQDEIKSIQSSNQNTQIIPPMRVSPVCTDVRINDRFSNY